MTLLVLGCFRISPNLILYRLPNVEVFSEEEIGIWADTIWSYTHSGVVLKATVILYKCFILYPELAAARAKSPWNSCKHFKTCSLKKLFGKINIRNGSDHFTFDWVCIFITNCNVHFCEYFSRGAEE